MKREQVNFAVEAPQEKTCELLLYRKGAGAGICFDMPYREETGTCAFWPLQISRHRSTSTTTGSGRRSSWIPMPGSWLVRRSSTIYATPGTARSEECSTWMTMTGRGTEDPAFPCTEWWLTASM